GSLNPVFCRIDPYPAGPLSWPLMYGLIVSTLVVTLTGLAPLAWAHSVDALTPPIVTIPFDEEDQATLQAEVMKQVLTFLQRVEAHWGQQPEALRLSVAGTVEHDGEGKLIYLRN